MTCLAYRLPVSEAKSYALSFCQSMVILTRNSHYVNIVVTNGGQTLFDFGFPVAIESWPDISGESSSAEISTFFLFCLRCHTDSHCFERWSVVPFDNVSVVGFIQIIT